MPLNNKILRNKSKIDLIPYNDIKVGIKNAFYNITKVLGVNLLFIVSILK